MKMKAMSVASAAPMMSRRMEESASVFSNDSFADFSSTASAPAVHVVINAPVSPGTNAATQKDDSPRYAGGGGAGAASLDYTQLPTQLDRNYEKFDTDSALRPTIINVGDSWTKKSQAALHKMLEPLSKPPRRRLPSTCWTRCLALARCASRTRRCTW